MMKLNTTVGLVGLLLVVGLVQARPLASAPARESKIGIVDMDDLLTTTPAAVRAREELDAHRKAKQDLLDSRTEELRRTAAELEKQKPTLDPQEFETRRKALETSFLELQKTSTQLERELAQEREVVVSNLMKLAGPALQRIAQSDGISVILERNSAAWFDPAIDLTERLKAELK